jgi:hypothetical protein
MTVDQKDVMGALVGAAGATAGFGLGLIGVVAGLLGLKTNLRSKLRVLTGAAVIAFLIAMLSSFLAFLWLAMSVWMPNTTWLGALYTSAILLFGAGILALVFIFAVFAWDLLQSDVFGMVQAAFQSAWRDAATRFAITLGQPPPQPPPGH